MVGEKRVPSKRLIASAILAFLSVSVLTGAFRIRSVSAFDPSLTRVDNIIITSTDLETAAVNLGQWKNSCGIPSIVLNTTWIYSHYGGVDEPEKIRNCIKDYYENFRIKYVTIFGDADKVPTRYAYVPDDIENSVATDLYYGDLNGTWNDNHDGLYADQRFDYVDGIPEVCVGRIPVSLVENAQPIVDKIVRYQQEFDPSQDWTRRVVLAAGTGNNGVEDTHGNGSEVLNDYIGNIAWNKDIVKLYEKAGNLSTTAMAQEINRGALFVDFAGHGDPGSTPIFSAGWLFYWVIPGIWWNGFGISDVRATTNGAKLPVVTTCSCSTARFDDADCIGEWFVGHPTGGAIAYFGSTRISYSYANNSAPYRFMGEMDWRIYQNFYEGFTRLGEMWRETVKEYVQLYVSNYSSAYNLDAKTIMEFALLGDPSLRISNGPKTLEVPDEYATIQGAINDANEGDTIFVRNGTYYENVVVNKTVSLVGEDNENTIINGNEQNVIYINASGVEVCRFGIWNASAGHGLLLSNCNDSVIKNLRLSNNGGGIYLYDCNNVSITNNRIYDTVGHAVFLSGSHFITIRDNSVLDRGGFGIYLFFSTNNVLKNNTICNGNEYAGNGVGLESSFLNMVTDCRIYNNGGSGVSLVSSVMNNIYHNNFIGNRIQTYVYESTSNLWDCGYPSGGNFWSDYSGADLFLGPAQDQTGSDGIGDTPYILDLNNTDRYPLMSEWSPPDVAALHIAIYRTIIGQGSYSNMTVLLGNRGNKIEELRTTFGANGTFIGNQTFLLKGGDSISYGYEWNSSILTKGYYIVSVTIEPIEGEVNLNDNTMYVYWIFITISGDLNGNKTVDIFDAIILANHFNLTPIYPKWDSNVDLNEDGIIDIFDAIVLAANYGKSWT